MFLAVKVRWIVAIEALPERGDGDKVAGESESEGDESLDEAATVHSSEASEKSRRTVAPGG